ncbi:hypothetical protein [Microbacterium lacticum]
MRIGVYTSLFGRYDGLVEPPSSDEDIDYICFTDDPLLRSERWDIRLVAPAFAEDSVRSARLLKIVGDESLDQYDVTLYVDASVRLNMRAREIVDAWLPPDADMALASHSYRETLLEEFDEVIRLNYDDRARVYEQLVHYGIAHPDQLAARPLWTGILVRRNNVRVRGAMRVWADHVLRYSRRDQLSVLIALATSGLRFHRLDVDNFASDSHEWPVIDRRRVALGKAPLLPIGPLIADLRRAMTRIGDLESEIERLQPEKLAELEVATQAMRREIEDGTAQRAVLEQQLAAALRTAGALEERERQERARQERERQEQLAREQPGVRSAASELRAALGRWWRRSRRERVDSTGDSAR